MTNSVSRPGGVTFIATLCAVFGSLEIVTGILSLVFLPALVDQGPMDATEAAWSAVGLIVLGLAYLLVSGGLFGGRDVARVIVLLVSLVHAVNALWLAGSGQLIPGLITIAVALIVVALLWTGQGAKYFARDTLSG